MKIKLYDDAVRRYSSRFTGTMIPNTQWLDILSKVQGMTLEVETRYLFKDQYNTVPIPGVSEIGLRVMDESVEYVIDDERPGMAHCWWCGKTSNAGDTCDHCGETGYLENF